MTQSTKHIPLSACAIAASLLLSACGGGDASAPPAPTPAPAPAPSAQTITFVSPGNQTIGVAPPALVATASSGLPVMLTSSSPTVCTVAASALQLVAAGTCVLSAGQAGGTSGGTTYAAATTVTNSFTIAAAPAPAPASTTMLSFDETPPPMLTDFGTSAPASAIVADPSNASNKVAMIVKPGDAQTWMGTTVSTCASQSIATVPLSTTNTVVTALFRSPDAGIPVRLKLENAADVTKTVETDAITTKSGAWETLSWNFTNNAPGTQVLNTATVFNKASVFPNFGVAGTPGVSKTYYIDAVTFPGATYSVACPGTGGTPGGLTGGAFSSNYSQVDAADWTSTEGGAAGTYIDTGVATAYWWNGVAPNDSTPSFYFGYGINVATKPWGFGAYVKAPANGKADVSAYTKMKISVWGNDELMNTHPTLTVLLKGPTINTCQAVLQGTVAVPANGVQTYTLSLGSMTLPTTCAFTSPAQALAAGVAEVHVQVLGANVQYVTGNDGHGNFPNGLNMGPITFLP